MAEPRYGSPWESIPRGPVIQGSEMTAPHHNSHAAAFTHNQYNTPYPHHGNSSLPPFTNASHATLGSESQGNPPFIAQRDFQRHLQCPPPPHMNQYYTPNSNPPATFGPSYGGVRPPMNGFNDPSYSYQMAHYPHMRDMHDPSLAQPQGYDPALSPLTPFDAFARGSYHAMNGLPPPASHYGVHNTLPGFERVSSERPRPTHFHSRRQSQQEPYHYYSRPFLDPNERRAAILLSAQNRRSDRSSSPRTSAARRSYERFSNDLAQASTSSDADEAAARIPPPNRARPRPREPRPRFLSQSQHFDPNIATPRQIQDLKDKLPRRLPSELPEKIAKMCDICSKDYSSDWVHSTEHEEIVVELPCGHYFGEFCLFEWFDTCRTQKNKVTCPMCRKQLIEPSTRFHPALLNALSRGGPALQELFANELRGDFAHV